MGSGGMPLSGLFSALGIRKQTITPPKQHPYKNKLGSLTKFSEIELPTLIERHYTQRTGSKNQNLPLNVPNLINYLAPGHQESVSVVQDAERLMAIAPEITAAKQIIISSIISPNDLQDADPIIGIDDLPNIPEQVKSSIIEYLTEYFVKKQQLGKKIKKWSEEALFRSGAAATITLPEATLTRFIGNIAPKNIALGKESLHSYLNEKTYNKILNSSVYSKVKSGYEFLTTEQDKLSYIDDKVKSSMEEIYNYIAQDETANIHLERIADKSYKSPILGLEAITAKIITKFEEGDIIKLSDNPEVLRFGKAVRDYEKRNMNKSLHDLWKEDIKRQPSIDGTDQKKEDDHSPILDLGDYTSVYDVQESLAYNLEIPTESIIPICIPGSKTDKLGYFVLLDSLGKPIDAKNYLNANDGCTISSRISNSYSAMFGSKPTSGGIQTPNFSNGMQFGTSTTSPEEAAITRIFDYILDQQLRQRLRGVGYREVEFSRYETIAKCMFYRMLEKKQTTILFVPEMLMTYVAFDYRNNGCGKSLLEDLYFVLSIRVALLVSNTMAMMKNAIAKRDITVTFDEKETNPDQILDMVRSTVIEKGQLNLSTDPVDVSKSILAQNITVKGINHPHASGFNIDSTYTNDSMPTVDETLMDKLSSWMGTLLGIPQSALNQLDEAEYSRSVATNNILFSQKNRERQDTISKFSAEWIRTNIRWSPELQKGIMHFLHGNIRPRNKEKTEGTVYDGGKDIHGSPIKTNKATLKAIIDNIYVELPASNIAPDKTSVEVLNDYTNAIGTVIDSLYPNEMIDTSDDSISTSFNVIKAFAKANMTKTFIEKMGLSEDLCVQELDDFIVQNRDRIMNFNRVLRNTQMDLTKDKVAGTTETEDTDTSGNDFGTDTSSDDSFGSSDSGFDYGGL